MTQPPATVGRYHVTRLIAHGGMGSLYLARDPAIERLVAIKLLKEGFDDAVTRERFAREARAAGRLHHPNIVTVYDVGEHDNRPFIAMEYVPGETLAQLITRRGMRRLSEKLGVLEVLCAALDYAHRAAIVHRDIKPANIMVGESGVVKVLDFGIARAGGVDLTRVGDVAGTLNYMSPEQLSGHEVDHRTDIYSVGVLAYELVTGQMCFPGSVDTGVLFKILHSAPPSIASRVPGIDPDIPTIIEHAMEKDPDARYQSLDDMRRDLADVRTRLIELGDEGEDEPSPDAETRIYPSSGSSAHPRPSLRASSMLSPTARKGTGGTALGRRRTSIARSPVFIGSAGVALLAAVLAAGWLATRPSVNDTAAPVTVTRDEAPPASTPSASPTGEPRPADDSPRTDATDELRTLRAEARKQIVGGERQAALATLTRALALDGSDPEINAMVDDVAQTARRTATEARAAAARRGLSGSDALRAVESREREAEALLRAGDRIPAIRAFWAAAAGYNDLPRASAQRGTAAPALERTPATVSPPTGPPVEPMAPAPNPAQVPATPAPLPSTSPSAAIPTPPSPSQSKPELSGAARGAPADPLTEATTAIRATLSRYRQAYQSLDSAAVGVIMPGLTAEQLRNLARDFANYRSYTVNIREERIAVDGSTATVICQVVRSFETKNGVAGSNTVDTVFHLQRTGADWTIVRLELR
jgi:serine/threonine protein kinase